MSPLRQQMISAMRQRGLSDRTHQTYLYAVRQLAKYFHRPPDELTPGDLETFLVYLVQDKGLSNASCRLHLNAFRFLYVQVLKRPYMDSSSLASNRFVAVGSTANVYPASSGGIR
jgi:integrase/recombinase XerD